MKRREFVRNSAVLTSATLIGCKKLPISQPKRIRTAHIGVGGMGASDLKSIASHNDVDIFALCDVDATALSEANRLYPTAKLFSDYRKMLSECKEEIDAVIVSTPDHTHAPASLMAMEMNKAIYCQKPLTHHVTEARNMAKIAKERNLITQMGIQVHSFFDYKLATILIREGIIGKVKRVRAWSPKNWGYDGPVPLESDPIPQHLDWNLWLGTAKNRPYKNEIYHPSNWRKLLDYGCGTFGDMGVHIFDTPYNALDLDVPMTIINQCRPPNGFGFPEQNLVTYQFPGTQYTTDILTWIWQDGIGAPDIHEDLILPDEGTLPDQGAMFIGEHGRLLLPHFMQLPRHIINDEYVELKLDSIDPSYNLGSPTMDYDIEADKHYHEFIDACLGKTRCSAPFSYAAKLTETILLGVVAGNFPNEMLHWNSTHAKFDEDHANPFLDSPYRNF